MSRSGAPATELVQEREVYARARGASGRLVSPCASLIAVLGDKGAVLDSNYLLFCFYL